MPDKKKDQETIFKEAIKNQLENQLRNFGYSIDEEWKGYLKYKCQNNYLNFIFEWNQTYDFYCEMGFHTNGNLDYQYSFEDIIQKFEKDVVLKKLVFGREFSERIEEWIKQISNQFSKYKIYEITNDKSVIAELRNDYSERDIDYNRKFQKNQTKRELF